MKVVILGAGTCALSVADILVQDRNFKLVGFVGTREEAVTKMNQKIFEQISFIGDHSLLPKLKQEGVTGFVSAMRNNSHREKAYYEAIQAGLVPINVISPRAMLEPSAKLGKGVVVNAGCIISHNVSIDNNVIIEAGSILGINCTCGDNCFISQGCILGGECHLGRNVLLGIRTSVLPYVNVGKNQEVEANTVIAKTLEDLIREEFSL